MLEEEEGNK